MSSTGEKCSICGKYLRNSSGQKKVLKSFEECNFFSISVNRSLSIGCIICSKCRTRAYRRNKTVKRNVIRDQEITNVDHIGESVSSSDVVAGTSRSLEVTEARYPSETYSGSSRSVNVSKSPKKGKT